MSPPVRGEEGHAKALVPTVEATTKRTDTDDLSAMPIPTTSVVNK